MPLVWGDLSKREYAIKHLKFTERCWARIQRRGTRPVAHEVLERCKPRACIRLKALYDGTPAAAHDE